MMFVTYCCKSKEPIEFGIPRELYKSQRIISFFNRFPGPRAILSYKYGIVEENEVIDNYDLDHFSNFDKVVSKVKSVLEDESVIFYSPRKLVEKPWLDLLEKAKVDYQIVRSYKDL